MDLFDSEKLTVVPSIRIQLEGDLSVRIMLSTSNDFPLVAHHPS
jgi:hypothetical protein